MRRGLSLVEALIAAMIIGVSALTILEAIRSGTRQLAVTEAEAAARQLGADLLRRVAGPRLGPDTGVSDNLRHVLAQPARWSLVLQEDAALAQGFPRDALAPLLDEVGVRLQLTIAPCTDPGVGDAPVDSAVVTVYWADRNERQKKVTLARLLER